MFRSLIMPSAAAAKKAESSNNNDDASAAGASTMSDPTTGDFAQKQQENDGFTIVPVKLACDNVVEPASAAAGAPDNNTTPVLQDELLQAAPKDPNKQEGFTIVPAEEQSCDDNIILDTPVAHDSAPLDSKKPSPMVGSSGLPFDEPLLTTTPQQQEEPLSPRSLDDLSVQAQELTASVLEDLPPTSDDDDDDDDNGSSDGPAAPNNTTPTRVVQETNSSPPDAGDATTTTTTSREFLVGLTNLANALAADSTSTHPNHPNNAQQQPAEQPSDGDDNFLSTQQGSVGALPRTAETKNRTATKLVLGALLMMFLLTRYWFVTTPIMATSNTVAEEEKENPFHAEAFEQDPESNVEEQDLFQEEDLVKPLQDSEQPDPAFALETENFVLSSSPATSDHHSSIPTTCPTTGFVTTESIALGWNTTDCSFFMTASSTSSGVDWTWVVSGFSQVTLFVLLSLSATAARFWSRIRKVKNETIPQKETSTSPFDKLHAFLTECKTTLRRTGHKSRKHANDGSNNCNNATAITTVYDVSKYDKLTLSDLKLICDHFGCTETKGKNKAALVSTVIVAYAKLLEKKITRAQIAELLLLHEIKLATCTRKHEMVKALIESAF